MFPFLIGVLRSTRVFVIDRIMYDAIRPVHDSVNDLRRPQTMRKQTAIGHKDGFCHGHRRQKDSRGERVGDGRDAYLLDWQQI